MQSRAAAQPLDGPLMQRYCALAKAHSLWLSLGGFQVLRLLCICFASAARRRCKHHSCRPAYMPAGRLRHTASGDSVIVTVKMPRVFGLLAL